MADLPLERANLSNHLKGTDTHYTVQLTPAKDLKPDDIFRDSGKNFRISDVDLDEGVVEITYYIGLDRLVNSFSLSGCDYELISIDQADDFYSSVPITRTN